MPVADRNGIVVLPPARKGQPGKHCGRNLEKIHGGGSGLTQKRTLKMQLKFHRRTPAPWESDFEVRQSLEQRIGVVASGRRTPPGQARPQRIQIAP
jgi:hypothetical protein